MYVCIYIYVIPVQLQISCHLSTTWLKPQWSWRIARGSEVRSGADFRWGGSLRVTQPARSSHVFTGEHGKGCQHGGAQQACFRLTHRSATSGEADRNVGNLVPQQVSGFCDACAW